MKTRVVVVLCALLSVHCGARSSLDDEAEVRGGGTGGSSVQPPTHAQLLVLDSETFQGRSRIDGFDDFTGAGFVGWEGDGTFKDACSPAIDTKGLFYFADHFDRIVRVDLTTGKYDSLNSASSGDKSFSTSYLAIDSEDRIYISDATHDRIIRVDDLSGAGWVSFGETGGGVGQLAEPGGIAVRDDGKIIVADAANHRVAQIDDMTGAGWQTWSVPVNPSYPISYPAGVAVDGLDRIYVVDFEGSVLHRIDGIDGGGHLQYFAAQQPKYVAVTQKGHIYLSLFNGADAVVSIDDISGSNYTELDGPPGHHFINPSGIVVK